MTSACDHSNARLEEDECGYITLLCDCSVPLGEMRNYCSCGDRPWGMYLDFSRDRNLNEAQAWALYVKLGGTRPVPEMENA
jgi:hypothetical protein